jgi:hypothetical protein
MTPYVYKIKSKHTGKCYIGCQYKKTANPNNFWKKYFTSNKYVKENVQEFQIVYVKPREDAREYERKLLSRLYSFYGKEKFCKLLLNRNLAPGIIHDEEERERISERLKKRWANGKMKNAQKKSTATKKTRVYAKVEFSVEVRRNISKRMKENNPMFDEDTRKKHKESMNTPESLKKKSKISKGNIYVKGKTWYNNGIECKMLFDCPEGWIKGRLNTHWNQNRKKKYEK